MKGILKNGEYIKHEKEKDKLRMGGGSWTINLGWFDTPSEIEKITYITEDATYQISFVDAVKNGFTKLFKGESKLVVPIKHWTIIKKNEQTNR